jgi:hypothetical protein
MTETTKKGLGRRRVYRWPLPLQQAAPTNTPPLHLALGWLRAMGGDEYVHKVVPL